MSAGPTASNGARQGFFQRLRAGLNRSAGPLGRDLTQVLAGRSLDDAAFDELETQLLAADVGVEATQQVMHELRRQQEASRIKTPEQLRSALRAALLAVLQPCSQPLQIPDFIRPFIILMVGVNGVGKTTTIGKLAQRFREQGLSVMLAAGDTFRAAAVEQLKVWGARNGVPVIAQGQDADAASVIFDAVQAAKARGIDVLIADTAGRLHTQGHLMEELRKIKRVIQKHDPYAPHEIMLVVDAGTGQNALSQAQQFHEAVGLTGITLTKLDGTAKGGVLFALARRLALPIRYIGVGEQREDLGVFDAGQFIDALFEPSGRETSP
jgi:fused signal recognition particle receptor